MQTQNRRTFLGTAAASLAAVNLTYGAGANQKIKMGLIGCGWYGMVDVNAGFKAGGIEIIALCDADSEHLKKSADEIEKKQGKRPKEYKDYRELLDNKELEAVIIATPPHWHALPFILACEKGLDIYCEKPVAYDIREGRAMVEAAKKSGRIIQFGFQRRKDVSFKAAAEFIHEGKAGVIKQVEAQINYAVGHQDAKPKDPPASLDWDLWCGPSPLLPYAECRGHFNWRLEKNTGHGHLTDWGIHLIDAIRVALRESTPKTVHTTGGLYYLGDFINTPDILTAHFEFDTCPVTWRHRMWGAVEYDPGIANGVTFYGSKATVFVTDGRWEIIPAKGERIINKPKSEEEAGVQHFADFIQAVRSRKPADCTPEDAFYSTATVQLAMISYETATKVICKNQIEQIENNPEAAKLLKREYRQPWVHPWNG